MASKDMSVSRKAEKMLAPESNISIQEVKGGSQRASRVNTQVLADVVADFSPRLLPLATKEALMVTESTSGVWILFTDGASNIKVSGLGVVLITHLRETLRQAIRNVPLTNNEAEYETLIVGLELAQGLESEVIEIKCDSQLVVNQVYGIFDAKEERTQQYVVKVQDQLA
ncbi:PREDICTED: uncharacterized protein LOC109212449 [Nicotiana attenuata]|uniref:uncharacterized protein LOC109212449 n=1 Tax=Nicotiana attenuata TaxID=49451 RepID=UPI000904D3E2|nr:PREDICTED: uncharacterized protein LOC109212449 [Nicotiana attenuata]